MASLREEAQRIQETKTPPRSPVTYSQTASFTASGDEAVLELPPGAGLGDIAELLRGRGLDPDDWHIQNVTVNEWDALAHGGGPDGEPRVVKLRQLKVTLRNRRLVLGPAVEVAKRYRPPATVKHPKKKPWLAASIGDQHAPYHDEGMHQAILRWLSEVKPAELVLAGDTGDYPTISRHRDRINWNASAQEVADASYRLLSDYADASPKTRRRKLRGNHDWRLESEPLDRAERIAFLRPADRGDGVKQPHLYSARRLLWLDELGYELVGEEGEDWRMAEADVAPGLVVRHEPPSLAKFPRLGTSVIAGHTHRQGIEMVRVRDDSKRWVTRSIIHAGCTCLVEGGQGYAADPDWQQGFATAAVYPDGSISYDLATYRDGVLTWRGERW